MLTESDGGASVPVYAQPRASRSRVIGVHDGMVKVGLAAPPVDGAANKALVALLASVAGVPRRAVSLASGHSGRRKLVRVEGIGADALAAALERATR